MFCLARYFRYGGVVKARGLENLLFRSADAPVAYSLLLDHKATDRSRARKTKFSRPPCSDKYLLVCFAVHSSTAHAALRAEILISMPNRER
jgi:hypothetical protein